MDVDLLRPGTVPISPDTILWFEFLLDENLLIKHLEKSAPDPTPSELITKFTTAVYDSLKNEIKRVEVENGDVLSSLENTESNLKMSLKVIALKILSLKVAAYMKWEPNALRSLPFKVQISVLQDLLFFTNNNVFIEIPNVHQYTSEMPEQHIFALIVYHRWFLGTCMHRVLNNFNGSRQNGDNITPAEESVICSPDNINKSVTFLTNALTWIKIPKMLCYDCFLTLRENSTDTKYDWHLALIISKEEFCAQIHYDIATFHFYKEEYDAAALNFNNCKQALSEIINPIGFANIDTHCLDNYILACNTDKTNDVSLSQQLQASILNQYTGILNILIQDNKTREIPLVNRINLELDIQGALSSGKFTVARDLLAKIQALNIVRCIVTQYPAHQYNFRTSKQLDFLIWATSAMWKSAKRNDKQLLSNYFTQLIINLESDELMEKLKTNEILNDIFHDIDVEALSKSIDKQRNVPDILQNTSWDFPDTKRNPKLDIHILEQKIIACNEPNELRELLVKLTMKNPSRPIWKINAKWELPIPLQSVVTSIPRGFLPDFSYVLLAKSRALMQSKDWNSAIEFLKILEADVMVNGGLSKLARLISWEILLVQITQLFEEWPAPHLDRQMIAQACESCFQNAESVIPRTEVMEQCVLCLLNLGRWEFLTNFNKPWSYFEIAAAITLACQDIIKYKGNKKVNKELWDLVIPAFVSSTSSQSKRSNTGNVIHRDSPNNSKIQLLSFLNKLRDQTAIAVVISMLAKLYNLLRDDSSIEIIVDYINLWPSTISSISSYNVETVSEALTDLIQQALKYYPTNVAWLRLMGDLCFANGNYENGLKYYLHSLIIITDYFNINLRTDDHTFRRMIKCCTQLGCHTQAAVLCQFLDEPDYTLAFRSLVDFKSCNDSVEAYYHCFWDINILEYLVHLHNKKGELQRRKKAINTIGLLELNANNNEEIQREAIHLRKRIFLQAMCKQYVH